MKKTVLFSVLLPGGRKMTAGSFSFFVAFIFFLFCFLPSLYGNVLIAGKEGKFNREKKKIDTDKFDILLYERIAKFDNNSIFSLFDIDVALRLKTDLNRLLPGNKHTAFEMAVLEKKDPILIRYLVHAGGKITDKLLSQVKDQKMADFLQRLKSEKVSSSFDSLLKGSSQIFFHKLIKQQNQLKKDLKEKNGFKLKRQASVFLLDLVSPSGGKESLPSDLLKYEFFQAGKKVAEMRFQGKLLHGWSIFYDPSGNIAASYLMERGNVKEVYFFPPEKTSGVKHEAAVILQKLETLTSTFAGNLRQGKYGYKVHLRWFQHKNNKLNKAMPKAKLLSVDSLSGKDGRQIVSFMHHKNQRHGLRKWYDEKEYCYAEEIFQGNVLKYLAFYMPYEQDSKQPLFYTVFAKGDPFGGLAGKVSLPIGRSDEKDAFNRKNRNSNLLSGNESRSFKLDFTKKMKIPFAGTSHYDKDVQILFPKKYQLNTAQYLQTYGTQSAGYSIRYTRGGCYADFFIYDANGKSVETEIKNLIGTLKHLEKKGEYKNLILPETVQKGVLQGSKSKYAAFYCRYTRKQNGVDTNLSSFSLVLKKNDKFVKLRISSPRNLSRKIVDSFIKMLDDPRRSGAVKGSFSAAHPPVKKKIVPGKKQPITKPYYDPALNLVMPLEIAGSRAKAFQGPGEKDPGYEICYIKKEFHIDLLVLPSNGKSREEGFRQALKKFENNFRILQNLKMLKKIPAFTRLPLRKFVYINEIPYQPFYCKHDLLSSENQRKTFVLAGIFFQLRDRNILITLFNNAGDQNNIEELFRFAEEFDRLVLARYNEKSTRGTTPPSIEKKDPEKDSTQRREFLKKIAKQRYL